MTTETDRLDAALLVSRFFRSLDERRLDEEWARAFFTDDVRGESPIGAGRGRAFLARHTAEALGRYARTQHIATDVVSETAPDGATATVSWNALMTHVHHDRTVQDRGPGADPLFTVGGRYRAEVRRTPDGWRFGHLAVEAVWTRGEPPVLPPGVGQPPA